MAKIRYALIGFGGIAENRVAKEGFACDKRRFKALRTLTGLEANKVSAVLLLSATDDIITVD